MRGKRMLSVAEAHRRVIDLIVPQPPETVALTAAAGRVLLADIVATRAQPPFAASAMDGYAVRAADAAEGAGLRVVATAAAGHAWSGTLGQGEAVRIFTGAPVPQGADAILIQEDADRDGDRITVRAAPAPGAFIRPAGLDFIAGARVTAPRRLTPRDIALIAAMGVPAVQVARRPVVALLPTGDELVTPGSAPQPDQIFASNSYGLAARIAEAGGVPRLIPPAADTPEGLLTALAEARGADIIVTLGGASVGDHDLVARVFGEAGLDLGFHRIAMRPGKPLMAGRIGSVAMLGLPGNPVSAMVCGELFLLPAIARALGLAGERPTARPAPLASPIPANGPREHYMRARSIEGRIEVAEDQDSSRLGILAEADGLVVRAPHAPAAAAGEPVDYIPL
ncbi:MAG: gephyrin-like molybdotransferase Glp [Pseudomonadota bacterium]